VLYNSNIEKETKQKKRRTKQEKVNLFKRKLRKNDTFTRIIQISKKKQKRKEVN